MKKLFAILLSLTILGSATACTTASAANYQSDPPTYSDDAKTAPEETLIGLVVNGKVVDTSKLPKAFYKEGKAAMVPVLVVCEKLGYVCEWDGKTGTLTIEDPVQKVVLTKGSKDAKIIGKLKVIDLSGTISLDAPMAVIDGVAYAPADLFSIFFDSVDVTDNAVSISETVYYPNDQDNETVKAAPYRIIVNGTPLDTKLSAYEKDGIIMLPLRAVGEALGYKVDWVPNTGIIMEDTIQKVVLQDASATAQFTWKLTNINLSGPIDLDTKVVVNNGSTFVPMSLFELFFNDVSVEGTIIAVSSGINELH